MLVANPNRIAKLETSLDEPGAASSTLVDDEEDEEEEKEQSF